MLGERRAELARAMLSRRRGRRSISVATAKLRKIIEKTKHFPNYFLTKAPPRHKETEAATDFRFSIFSFGGNRSKTPDLTPGACPHDCFGITKEPHSVRPMYYSQNIWRRTSCRTVISSEVSEDIQLFNRRLSMVRI